MSSPKNDMGLLRGTEGIHGVQGAVRTAFVPLEGGLGDPARSHPPATLTLFSWGLGPLRLTIIRL